MARINVFLKDDLLKAVDAEARLTGTKRSALIQGALERHLDRMEEPPPNQATPTPTKGKTRRKK